MPTTTAHSLAHLWRWWLGELGGMLPGPLRAALLPRVERLYLKTESERIISATAETGFGDDNPAYPLPPAEMDTGQARELGKLVASSREIILLLPAGKVLVKSITLPLVAETNLREVLGFEMDRQTPFSLDKVYYDHRLLKRDTRAGKIEVELVVTPRKYLDELLERLRQLGIRPHRATAPEPVGSGDTAINLVPESRRPAQRNSARHLNLALALIALGLLAVSVSLPLVNKMQRIEALEKQVELKTRKAGVIQRLGKEIEQLDSAANFLADKKRGAPLKLKIIDELTRILPDNTWVNNLSVKGREVQIQGFSAASARLIPLIDASDLFDNPRFRSSVTTSSQNSEEERFHLSMEIAGGDAS